MVNMPASSASLPAGIYCPVVTFFKPTPEQELDIETHIKHIEWLGRSGIQGVVVQGSTGEAVALSREERNILTKTAAEAFKSTGNDGPIIVGTVGAQSTQQAIEFAKDAAANGGSFVLVLPPGYYAGVMTNTAIQAFFEKVADASPIPVLIYSYPGVCSGIDMDSDLIATLARHPNIVGVKHTDHNIGKMARVVAQKPSYGAPFTVLGGATDYLLGSLGVAGEGAITGLANIAPRVCLKATKLFLEGKQAEALELAQIMSIAEFAVGKANVLSTKYATVYFGDYPKHCAIPRHPLPECPADVKRRCEEDIAPLVKLERALEAELP